MSSQAQPRRHDYKRLRRGVIAAALRRALSQPSRGRIISPMIEALHIVDNRARPDILEQLDMLAGAGERILSAGPPPAGMARPVKPVHCTMGSARLAGWRMRELVGTAQVIHAWSAQALWAGRELALATGRAPVLTIPAAPTTPDDWKTLRQAVGPGLVNVVAPTDFARRQLIAGQLPARFCHALPPAARALARPDEARGEVRGALGIGAGTKLLVAPDPLVRYAGHEYASWSHAILRHVPLDLRLAFPSSGPMADHMRFFAHTTGFDAEVHFTHGRFSVAQVIAASDITVFPQTRDVGVFTMAAAMAAGRTIVASNIGGMAELAGDGEVAALIEPGPRETSAGLLKLADDDDLARRLGRAARDWAAKMFDPSAVAAKLQAIYAAALETKAH